MRSRPTASAALRPSGSCRASEKRVRKGREMNRTERAKLLFSRAGVLVVATSAFSQSALAHSGADAALGLKSGFVHPLTGLDHLVAMVAVGLWGAQLGNPAIWVLPITFPLVMAVGGILGISGFPLP